MGRDGRAQTPEEKEAIIERLKAAWLEIPHLRLGQLIQNAVKAEACYDSPDIIDPGGMYLFFVEDESLADSVTKFAQEYRGLWPEVSAP